MTGAGLVYSEETRNVASSPGTVLNLVGVWAPQHLLGLAEARLRGLLSGDVHLALMTTRTDFRRRTWQQISTTFTALSSLLEARSVKRIRVLPGTGRTRVVQWASSVCLGTTPSDVTMIGAYPGTEFWPPITMRDGKRFWIDDGTESLYAGTTAYRPEYLNAGSLVGGGKDNGDLQSDGSFFTAFPVTEPLSLPGPPTLIRHRFEKLSASERRRQEPGIVKARVLGDTNLGILGEELHWEYVSRVVRSLGVNVYIPHRRTSRSFTRRVAKLLPVSVLDLNLPMELAANRILDPSCEVYLAPSSLWVTYPLFACPSQEVTLLRSSNWLRAQTRVRQSSSAGTLGKHLLHQWEILEMKVPALANCRQRDLH